MQNINIGTEVNLQKLLETSLLIQAGSGGGKSYALRQVIESIGDQVQQIIIDPEGEFVTLREQFNFALVAKEGDIPLNVQYAETLAHKILETGISVIIDLYELKAPERIQFVKRFLEAMINAPKNLWHDCFVHIDEAHIFCPESGKADSTAAVIDLNTRGRKRGFGRVLATQRLAMLNKGAAAECLNKMIGRTGLDIDRKRAGEELGMTSKSEILDLRKLKPGEFFTFGPAISDEVQKFTVATVKTTHLESGKRLASKPPTPKAIARILSKLSDIPEEAEKDLVTRQQLQGEVTRLRGEVNRLSKGAPAAAKAVEQDSAAFKLAVNKAVTVASNEIRKTLLAVIKDRDTIIRTYRDQIGKLQAILQKINQLTGGTQKVDMTLPALNLTLPEIPKADIPVPVPERIPPRRYEPDPAQPSATRTGPGGLSKPARAIIGFLAAHQDRDFTKAQISVATGYSANSSSFSNAMGELNGKGFIIRGTRIRVQTDKLQEISDAIGGIPEAVFSVDTFKKQLTKCELEIYEILLASPNHLFSKESLAAATPTNYSPTSSSFHNALGRLNSLELISRNKGQICLNPDLIELL